MIGIMGGTFDPVHNGHLRAALEAKETLSLEKVLFIPARIQPLKGQPHSTEQDRINMLKLAIESVSTFELDDREMQREGRSYSIDTLRSLQEDYPHEILVFLLGIDAFQQFKQWKDWEEILSLAHLAIMHRPGYVLDQTDWDSSQWASSPDDLQQVKSGLFLPVPVTPLEISSSAIRQQLLLEKNAQFLLPEKVRLYIQMEKLYLR